MAIICVVVIERYLRQMGIASLHVLYDSYINGDSAALQNNLKMRLNNYLAKTICEIHNTIHTHTETNRCRI